MMKIFDYDLSQGLTLMSRSSTSLLASLQYMFEWSSLVCDTLESISFWNHDALLNHFDGIMIDRLRLYLFLFSELERVGSSPTSVKKLLWHHGWLVKNSSFPFLWVRIRVRIPPQSNFVKFSIFRVLACWGNCLGANHIICGQNAYDFGLRHARKYFVLESWSSIEIFV
jgi:hypothetical protein